MVTGTVLNASRSASGWASYFLDHSAGLPGRGSGPLSGPPDHCSYMRHHLLQVGGFPEEMRAGEDTVVNRELARLGYRAYRAADVRLYHRSPCTNPARLVSHHFTRGRALARIVLDDDAPALRNLLIGYLPRRLSWTTTNVRRWGGPLTTVYRRVLPLVVLGALSSWAGCSYEILRRQAGDATPSGRAPSSVSAERNLHLGRETSAVPGTSDDGDAAGRALREVQG